MVSQAEYADSHRVLVPTAQFDGLGCRDAFQSSVIRHRRRQPQGSPPEPAATLDIPTRIWHCRRRKGGRLSPPPAQCPPRSLAGSRARSNPSKGGRLVVGGRRRRLGNRGAWLRRSLRR